MRGVDRVDGTGAQGATGERGPAAPVRAARRHAADGAQGSSGGDAGCLGVEEEVGELGAREECRRRPTTMTRNRRRTPGMDMLAVATPLAMPRSA